MTTKIINSQKEMQDFAAQIASKVKTSDVIGLKGTLGAGKSFFASAFINALSDKKVDVTSPTFNLLHSYKVKIGNVHHFDLYRIKNLEELENIGFYDCLNDGICLIEWPEIIEDYLSKSLPKRYFNITISIDNHKTNNQEQRLVQLKLLKTPQVNAQNTPQ
jgi:tRNA threonylcarbamoyl adenosine modification protein YjeE